MRTNNCRKPAEATGSGTRCPVRSHEKGYRLIMFGFYTPKILVELEQDVKSNVRWFCAKHIWGVTDLKCSLHRNWHRKEKQGEHRGE